MIPHLLHATFFALTASALASDPLPSRLYIHTSPPGARIMLDQEDVGVSDMLLEVKPGSHWAELRLDGFISETRQVQVAPEQITRLELQMKRIGSTATGTRPAADAAQAAASFLTRTELPAEPRAAILTVIRQHPGEIRWSGRTSSVLFGVVARPLPRNLSAGPGMLQLAHSQAVQELLCAKWLLDVYADAGLTDATTLRQAVIQVAGRLQASGTVKEKSFQASAQDGFAVAYSLADSEGLKTRLLRPADLSLVKDAYRDVMHAQARDLMTRQNWTDALLLWRHLHSRKLVSQMLYLDAARCMKALGEGEDAVRVLSEAMTAFQANATPDFLEQAGDLAMTVDTKDAHQFAEQAYQRASDALLNTVSLSTTRSE